MYSVYSTYCPRCHSSRVSEVTSSDQWEYKAFYRENPEGIGDPVGGTNRITVKHIICEQCNFGPWREWEEL